MTDAKCPWCGAVQRGKSAYVDHGCGMATRFVCGSVTLETLHQRTDSQSEECLRTELAQHKTRLAAAESELRRLRQVIEAAPVYRVDNVDGRLKFVDDCGVVCCLVPLETLEAKNAD